MNRLKRIIALALLVCLMEVLIFPVMAEEGTFKATFHVKLRTNKLFAKYGVTVYLSDVKLGHLNPGDQLTTDVYLTEGVFELTFVPDKKSAEKLVWTLGSIRPDYVVECELQTHLKRIEMKKNSIRTVFGTLVNEEAESGVDVKMLGTVVEIIRNITQIFK